MLKMIPQKYDFSLISLLSFSDFRATQTYPKVCQSLFCRKPPRLLDCSASTMSRRASSHQAAPNCTSAAALPRRRSSGSVTSPRGTGRYGRYPRSSSASLNSSATRNWKKNSSALTNATNTERPDGQAPRSSADSATAEALKARISGPWPASGKRSR